MASPCTARTRAQRVCGSPPRSPTTTELRERQRAREKKSKWGKKTCPGGEGGPERGGEWGWKPVVECPYTRLYSFKFSCRMVSFTAANTNLMFSVSVAHVK